MFAPDTRLLVVDDMLTMRKIVSKACRELGFKDITEAADGAIAWKTLNENPGLQLVVSDWNMPNMTGLDLLKRVRQTDAFKDLPFVMLTAEKEKEQITQAIAAGVDNYIIKPFNVAQLRAKLQQVYNKRAKKAA